MRRPFLEVANNVSITTVDFLARRSVVTVVLSGPQTKSKLVVIFHTDITLINFSNLPLIN